ncbi:hypothetical protein GCM10009830_16640 [Glycomyces endophyticus]|uniref:Uncharacterized protein n=1 Tax=Glycomyces endophyticus TaxID=480996 RepID=A0ABN2GHE1_9ACTN
MSDLPGPFFPAAWPLHVRVRFAAPAERIAAGINAGDGVVEAVDEHSCVLVLGGSDPLTMAAFLCMFDVDFELLDAGPVLDALHTVENRCRKASKSLQS